MKREELLMNETSPTVPELLKLPGLEGDCFSYKRPFGLATLESKTTATRDRALRCFAACMKSVAGVLTADDETALALVEASNQRRQIDPNRTLQSLARLASSDDIHVKKVALSVLCGTQPLASVRELLLANGASRSYVFKGTTRNTTEEKVVTPVSFHTFAKYRRQFDKLLMVHGLDSRKHKLHVSTPRLLLVVQWIQENFPFKPAASRNVRLKTGDRFFNLPVFQISQTHGEVYEKYKGAVGSNSVGRDTFKDILQLLTVRTKQSVGLSDRYTGWLHLCKLVDMALQTLESFKDAQSEPLNGKSYRRPS